uniref:methylated diphthine methylhydrolase n=1 Tax=Percolomonas cosmopolitus TaxID=63605 RepID=A0A7S1PJL8_9EUKA
MTSSHLPLHSSNLTTFTSNFTSDVVEWNPRQKDHCILATYQLQKETGSRVGSLEGFKIVGGDEKDCHSSSEKSSLGEQRNIESSDTESKLSLSRTHTTDVDFGIFDVKFSFHQDLLVAAGSGKTVLYDVSSPSATPKALSEHFVENEQIMCCSADWNNRLDKSLQPHIFVSTSKGELIDLQLTSDRGLEEVNTWQGHDYEAWIVASNYFNPNVLYSGGDDMKLKGWDLRALEMGSIFSLSTHEAGVCCIHKHPSQEHTLVTGSYDNYIYLWDTRSMRRPVNSVFTDGGVWRLKWHPTDPKYLLSACMRAFFQVYSVDNDQFELMSMAELEDGENLAYGCDWCYAEDSLTDFHFASCSFYNREMQWWHVKSNDTISAENE